ncbi:MAG: hypothetical protein K2Y20_07005 [Sphingomonas sp.]|nr:hypothetical protein [Sphingomonas sp.]
MARNIFGQPLDRGAASQVTVAAALFQALDVERPDVDFTARPGTDRLMANALY